MAYMIRRKIEIDAAHRVPLHDSKCKNLHGHRYVVEAQCVGGVISMGAQSGMVMDFSFLKECMITTIYDHCDHGLILQQTDNTILSAIAMTAHSLPQAHLLHIGQHCGNGWKIYLMEDVPTAENLACLWYHELTVSINRFFSLTPYVPPTLECVRVWETPNCMAEYPHG